MTQIHSRAIEGNEMCTEQTERSGGGGGRTVGGRGAGPNLTDDWTAWMRSASLIVRFAVRHAEVMGQGSVVHSHRDRRWLNRDLYRH